MPGLAGHVIADSDGGKKLMKKIIQIIAVTVILGLTTQVSAQLFNSTSKVGTTSAQFLKIGAGARAIGMGGAYSAIDGDIYSAYWNPAGIATMKGGSQATFNHASWLADITYDYAGLSINLEDMGVVFATLTTLQVPEEKVRTYDNPEGDGRVWDASSMAISVGYAKMLTDRFSIGFNVKYIRESIWNTSANGFALDVGTLYRTPFNDLKIAASISNFGSKMQLDGRDIQFNYDPNDNIDTGPNDIPAKYEMGSFDLPLVFRIGLSMDVINSRFFRTTAALDAVHPNDNTEYVNTGIEFAYDEMIFFRAGYKQLFMDNKEGGLTIGGGIKYGITNALKIFVNYGYADYGRLENVQFFDVGLIF